MKRGNTALKRAVSVASVAAMGLALAVVAAPAASAAAGLTPPTDVRATPIADASLITDDGSLATTAAGYVSTRAYGTGATTTGALPTVTAGNGQAASGIQVLIPSHTADEGAFVGGDSFSIALNNGAKFSTGAATLSGPFTLADLDDQAGYSNATKTVGITTATVPDLANTPEKPINPGYVSAAVQSDGTLKVTFSSGATDPNTTLPTTAGYLVSISNVNVNVPNDASPGALVASIVGGTNAATVIGYVSPFTVSAGDDGYSTTSTGLVKLPNVTVSANSKNGFDTSTASTLSVSGDAATTGTPPVFANGADDVKLTPSATLNLGSGNGTAVTVNPTTADSTVTPAGVDADRLLSYVASGLQVSLLKAGADVTLELTSPKGTVPTSGQSAWSAAPVQTQFPSVKIAASSTVPRLAGANRYATAAEIATEYVDANGDAGNTVVLANGTDSKLGIDALAANFLAGAKDAPILLTDSSDSLPKDTQDALAALFKNSAGDSDGEVTIYVMGKTDSVSQAAEDQAVSIVEDAVNAVVSEVNVVRVDGDNRYKTSAKAVTEAGSAAIDQYNLGSGFLRTAFLASGAVNADALAAGGLSAGAGIPVLLANGDSVDDSVATVISDLNIKQLIVLGSTDRIADSAIDGLKDDHGVTNVIRIAGSGTYGRYDTAAQLNDLAFIPQANGLGLAPSATAYLASGAAGFADALTVGPLAGVTTSAVLTVPQNLLPDTTRLFLRAAGDLTPPVTGVEALGQTDRIADSVVTAAQDALK